MIRIPQEFSYLIGAVAAFTLAASPVNAQEQQEIEWSVSATEWRSQTGKVFNVYCVPGGVRAGVLWGLDVYTDDSSICLAAVHSLATFDVPRGGTVYFRMEPGQEGYNADRRRGVQSQTWAAWPSGFRVIAGVPGKRLSQISDSTPVEITWTTSARHLRGNDGAQRVMFCPRDGNSQTVWGTSIYADDSSICAAAVHAGLITFAKGGSVTLQVEAGREGYKGTKKHGVSSLPWEKWDGSFTFPKRQIAVALPAPGVDAPAPASFQPSQGFFTSAVLRQDAPVFQQSGEYLMSWTSSADSWQGQRGPIIKVYCPAGGRSNVVWGSGEYTADSSVCTAAVHALATFDFATGGTAYITMTPGLTDYPAEQRRGVSSLPFKVFPSSFRVMAGVPGKRPTEIGDTTVTELGWSTTGEHLRGKNIDRKFVCAAQGRTYPVWGSDEYSDQSSICVAAVHAGVITRTTGGPITVRFDAGRHNYTATTRNEVTTQAFGVSGGSFSFRRN